MPPLLGRGEGLVEGERGKGGEGEREREGGREGERGSWKVKVKKKHIFIDTRRQGKKKKVLKSEILKIMSN